VGGKTRLHSLLPGAENLSSVYDYQRLRADEFGVKFHFDHKASADDVLALQPDVVILASGSTPAWPHWLPEDYRDAEFFPDVRTVAARFATRRAREAGTAVIYDQDHTAFTYATAQMLAQRYDRVVIVTPREGVAAEEPLVNRQGIHRRLPALGIEVQNWCEPMFDEGLFEGRLSLRPVHGGAMRYVEGVSLLTHATPRIPNDELVAPLRAAGVELLQVGDCHAPRSLLIATGEGYRAGMGV